MQARQGPTRPKKPEARTTKVKKSETDKSYTGSISSKFNLTLTDAQKVQVSIIDWKRWAIRALLFQSYVILVHGIVSICMAAYGHQLIGESYWLAICLYGFIVNIMLYFFGSGEAIMAISYVWSCTQFVMGVVLIFIGIGLNIGLFLCGTMTTNGYTNGLPTKLIRDCANKTLLTSKPTSKNSIIRLERIKLLCELHSSNVIQNTVKILPLILPPVTAICTLFACFAAFYALKVVPKRFQRGVIDAKYVEPYETYDFYVGRLTPKIAGEEDVTEEQSNIVTLSGVSGEQEETSAIRSRGGDTASIQVKRSASALTVTGNDTTVESNVDVKDQTDAGKGVNVILPASGKSKGADKSKSKKIK